jgi:hypothetical protein
MGGQGNNRRNQMPIEKTYCVCPSCGHRHVADNREISLFKGMSRALFRVYKWCKENGRHEFQRKDVKHLFGGESVSARFGDWVWFGGLVYKGKKAHYGLNMERCHDFFSGQRQIPARIEKSSVKNEIVRVLEYQNAKDIHELYQLLTEDGEYKANYIPKKPGQNKLL